MITYYRRFAVAVAAISIAAAGWAAAASPAGDQSANDQARCNQAVRDQAVSDQAEIAALKSELAELKKSAYHPELGEQMLGIQIRHARLWFAGQAQNWTLATFELQELKEAFDAVVEQNPEHAIFQPQRLADILPAMIKQPIVALRDAIDHGSKAEFEHAYDGLSAACSGCHHVAGNDFLVIQRPTAPILDNLRAAPVEKAKK